MTLGQNTAKKRSRMQMKHDAVSSGPLQGLLEGPVRERSTSNAPMMPPSPPIPPAYLHGDAASLSKMKTDLVNLVFHHNKG